MRNEVCDSSKNISKCPTNTDVYMKPLLEFVHYWGEGFIAISIM
jgi:hypothetical protein